MEKLHKDNSLSFSKIENLKEIFVYISKFNKKPAIIQGNTKEDFTEIETSSYIEITSIFQLKNQ